MSGLNAKISEIEKDVARIKAWVGSELGTSQTVGNVNRRIDALKHSVEKLDKNINGNGS